MGRAGIRISTTMLAAFLTLAAVLASFAVVAPSPASAQEQAERPWRLRDLFRPRRSSRVEPQAEAPAARKKPKTRTVRAPAEPAVPEVEKLPDAKVVLVIGDFMGAGLAEGLAPVYAENPNVRVVDRTNGSSGFVRDDFYDWPRKVGELIDAEKPAAVLVMIGANDRQQMRVGETREAPLTDAWSKEYAVRAGALAKAVADRRVPMLWVGVPAFKSPRMLTDMLAFNDVYRGAAESVGAEFVDVWDGFVDENGAFVTTGPDINGQPVRLRAADGINLTRPGKRKVAFYAEKPLAKLLGETGVPGVAALAPAAPMAVPPQVDIGSIVRTQPVSLKDPELDGGTELLGLVAAPKTEARSPGEKLLIEGIAPDARPGRADDFSARPPAAPANPATADRTGAIRQ